MSSTWTGRLPASPPRAAARAGSARARLVGTSGGGTPGRERELVSDRLRLATADAGIGVWEWVAASRELLWDPTMHALYGLAPVAAAISTAAWEERLHPADRSRTTAEMADALRGGRAFDTSFRVLTPDGAVRRLRTAAMVRRDAMGAPIHMTGVSWAIDDDAPHEPAHEADPRVTVDPSGELAERNLQLDVLLRELHHRVKNNLQIVISLLNMQARRAHEERTREALAAYRARIVSIALVHEQLYQSRDYARVPFSDYVERLSREVVVASGDQAARIDLAFELESLMLPIESAVPCGLILNELVTNAFRHAFPGGRQGTVRVVLRRDDDTVRLAVADDGVGIPDGVDFGAGESLGGHLVSDLCLQLGASLDVRRGAGTRIEIALPALSASVAEPA